MPTHTLHATKTTPMRMHKTPLTLLAALALAAVTGCQKEAAAPPAAPPPAPAQQAPAPAPYNPASAAPGFDIAGFVGAYANTLPCADCGGIDTTLTFAADGSYQLDEVYQDDTHSSFSTKGRWEVKADGKTLRLTPDDKDEVERWFVVHSPTELHQLDRDGKPIQSPLDYSLRRK